MFLKHIVVVLRLAALLFCVVFCLLPPVSAQQWQAIPLVKQSTLNAGLAGGEGGQQIRAIAIDSTGAFLMFGTDVGGLYRSTDGGNTWEPANAGFSAKGANGPGSQGGLAIDPNNSNNVVVCGTSQSVSNGANGLYLSTNQGASWTQVLSRNNNQYGGSVAYSRSQSGTVYFCSDSNDNSGLWKSTGGGASGTWALVNSSGSGSQVTVNPLTGRVYLSNGSGFYYSDNGGSSFTQTLTSAIDGVDVVGGHVYASLTNSISKSLDAGLTWTTLSTTGVESNSSFHNVRVNPANENDIVFCRYWIPNTSAKQWYYTSNGGSNWAVSGDDPSNSIIPEYGNNPCMVWHPSSGTVWASKGDFISKSADAGAHFAWANSGYTGIWFSSTFNLSPTHPGAVATAFLDYTMAWTTSSGSAWSTSGYGTAFGAYTPDGTVIYYGQNAANAYDRNNSRTLNISLNGGTTFTALDGTGGKQNVTWNNGDPDVGYSDPTSDNVLFASKFRSGDHGATWQLMNGCVGVYTQNYNSSGNQELLGKNVDGSGNTSIVYSIDHGVTWQTITQVPGGFYDIAYDWKNNAFYVTNYNQPFQKYTVGTGTWSTVNTPANQQGAHRELSVAIDPIDPTIVYVGSKADVYSTSTAVLRSTNSGANWTVLTNSAPLNGANKDAAHEVQWIRVNPSTRYAWVGTGGYGLWQIAPPAGALVGQNLGFESPSIGTGGSAYLYNPQGAAWTFSGQAGIAANGSNFNNPNAPQGTQVAFVQNVGSISQSLPGFSSGAYTLTVSGAQRSAYNPSGNQTVNVLVDGTQVGAITPTSGSFADYSVSLGMLSAGSHTLLFQGTVTGGDSTAFLDNVRTAVGAAVPPLSRTGWIASASSSQSGEPPSAVLDGSLSTIWQSGAAQANGQWFAINLGSPQSFSKVVLDVAGVTGDYPRGYQFFVSTDGVNWGSSIASNAANTQGEFTTITFPTQSAKQYLKVVQTGSASNWWTIAELNVYPPDTSVIPPLSRTGWVASASSSQSGEPPSAVLDGSLSTIWQSGAAQANGQWFAINLGSPQSFSKVVLDVAGVTGDYPRGYQFFVSTDGVNWGSSIASNAANTQGEFTTITFPTQSAKQYLKVVQTGSASNWWTIAELNVYP